MNISETYQFHRPYGFSVIDLFYFLFFLFSIYYLLTYIFYVYILILFLYLFIFFSGCGRGVGDRKGAMVVINPIQLLKQNLYVW